MEFGVARNQLLAVDKLSSGFSVFPHQENFTNIEKRRRADSNTDTNQVGFSTLQERKENVLSKVALSGRVTPPTPTKLGCSSRTANWLAYIDSSGKIVIENLY